jgi:hypothetical protein
VARHLGRISAGDLDTLLREVFPHTMSTPATPAKPNVTAARRARGTSTSTSPSRSSRPCEQFVAHTAAAPSRVYTTDCRR